MRKWIAALSLLALFTNSAQAERETEVTVRAMTFNIRFNNPNDGVNAWPNRRDWVAEIIRDNDPDVIGLQEVLPEQLSDLKERLPGYTTYSVGRQDGRDAGEAVPILFKTDRFELVEKATFWLSVEPETVGSVGWDAALPRVCSWVRLKHKASGKELLAFNTHFDHRGPNARVESAKLLVKRIGEIAGDHPALLTGDFNCLPAQPPYGVLTAQSSGLLQDARQACHVDPVGPDSTWNGFLMIIPGRRIDFIFVTPQLDVTSHRTLTDSRDGRFPSDHLPVLAELRLQLDAK